MMWLIQLLSKLFNLFNRTIKKELKAEDFALITMLVTGVLLTVVAAVTAKYWLPLVLILILIVWSLIPEKNNSQLTVSPYGIILDCVFKVVCEIYNRIGAEKPLDLNELECNPYFSRRDQITIWKIKIPKSTNIYDNHLTIVLKKLRGRLNDLLRKGEVDNIPFNSLDGNIPIIWIDDIRDNSTHYLVDVVYVATSLEIEYVKRRSSPLLDNQSNIPTDCDF